MFMHVKTSYDRNFVPKTIYIIMKKVVKIMNKNLRILNIITIQHTQQISNNGMVLQLKYIDTIREFLRL
jgi:hypothetical protein